MRAVPFILSTILLALVELDGISQVKWTDPASSKEDCIQQHGFSDELKNCYSRLPLRFKDEVPDLVWEKAGNASGLAIYFYTDSPAIHVRYQVEGPLNSPDMSTIGTSGCDLRYVDKDGIWHDAHMNYDFGDTVKLSYRYLDTSLQHEYRLYLPLYNTVKWLEIGVSENSSFKFAAPRAEKPVVVYGTSICQGGDVCRAGNSWTNLLSQYLDWPVVNFGFDGCGKMESRVVEAVSEVDASVYILDNLYNLTEFPVSEKVSRIVRSVHILKSRHPEVPVIIAGHTGHNSISHAAQRDSSNKAVRIAMAQLEQEGYRGVSILEFEGAGVDGQGNTVEGVHLNDHGTMVLARYFEAHLRDMLGMPDGTGTSHAVTQRRMPQWYDWQELHREILQANAARPPRSAFIGDSIVHYWGGSAFENGKSSWDSRFAPLGYVNLGMAWDRIENMLWRVNHGELDGYAAETVLVEAGSNNTEDCTDGEIVEGVINLLQAVRLHQPEAVIRYVAILPCRNEEQRIKVLNKKLKKAVLKAGFEYCDPGRALLSKDGKSIDTRYFKDDAHPNEEGYSLIVDDILN